MIEKVVKEFDSKKEEFPDKETTEGKMLIQTVKKEALTNNETN